MLFFYYIPDLKQKPEDAIGIEVEKADGCNDIIIEEIAKSAGEHYWNYGQGWEDQWPVDMVLLDSRKQEFAVVSVSVELLPHFSMAEGHCVGSTSAAKAVSSAHHPE